MKKIPLTNSRLFAIVSDTDFELVSRYKWRLMKDRWNTYAWRNPTKHYTGIFMHCLIMPPLENMMTDHIDGNGLNNQKENIRHCTNSQNQAKARLSKSNTSGYRGVRYEKRKTRRKHWRAYITNEGRTISLGIYNTAVEAARAYNQAAKKLFGEYAYQNPLL